MKNQWFGDKYDFRKYGLLYFLLTNFYDRICVAWMLTEDDSEAKPIPKMIREKLSVWMNVSHAESCFEGLPKEKRIFFYKKKLDNNNREDWLNGLKTYCEENKPQLVFFDADNGFDVVCKNEKNMTYIYLEEIKEYTKGRIDILLYQHRTRNMKISFKQMCTEKRELLTQWGYSNIKIIKATGDLAFFLIHMDNNTMESFKTDFNNSFGVTKTDKKYLELLELD